ncbi:diacylglycerol O-acyltransferase 2-like, partial [Latimeria chalumnae]
MQKKHLEALSALQMVLTFLLMGVLCSVLMIYLLFTSLWLLPVLYAAWLIFDWNTPEQGGRRLDWVRRWTVWKHARDYYPVRIIKTADLTPDRNYILGYHPHGILCAGAFINFCTEATNFSKVFPGITSYLCTLVGLFRMPIYRDYIMTA